MLFLGNYPVPEMQYILLNDFEFGTTINLETSRFDDGKDPF